MILVYITFFIILNCLIFLLFIKNFVKINKILALSIIISFLTIFLHFFIFNQNYISHEKFLTLLCASLAIILFYFGSKIPIMTMEKIHGIDLESHAVYFFFNFIRNYFIPVAITLIQIIMLLDL